MFGKINLDKKTRQELIRIVEEQHKENTELMKKAIVNFDKVIKVCVANEVEKKFRELNSEKIKGEE